MTHGVAVSATIGASNKRVGAVIRADLIAGLTVTLVGLPQCLAYALVAGLPPAYGLTTAAVAGFVAAVAQKSVNVVTGPTNTTGLLVLAALAPYLGSNGLLQDQFLGLLASLTLMAGVLRIAGAWLGAGSLIRFIPESVLIGFTAGAGILIGVMQFDEALGMTTVRGANLWTQGASILNAHEAPALVPVAVAISTIVLIAAAKRWAPRIPAPLILVGLAAALAPFIRDAGFPLPVVSDVASIPSGWPKGAMPSTDWHVYQTLALPSLAIVLLGTLELTVVTRQERETFDVRREIQAQGLGNLVGAFFANFPASASLTRSALLQLSGARTRLAAAASAIVVLPVIYFGGGIVGAVPQASLAGVLLFTAYGMVKWPRIQRVWRTSRASRLLLACTLIATLTLPFVYAIFIGVGLGLLIHIGRSSKPRLTLLQPRGHRLLPVAVDVVPSCVVVEISGELYFAAASALPASVLDLVPNGVTHVVLDLTHARHGRFAAVEALEMIHESLEARGIKLGLAGIVPSFEAIIQRVHLDIPHTAFHPIPGESALLCCRQIGGHPID